MKTLKTEKRRNSGSQKKGRAKRYEQKADLFQLKSMICVFLLTVIPFSIH